MRQCIFCKGHTLTNEDAWPVWLIKAIPGVGPGKNYAMRGEDELPPWKSKMPQQKVKYVCGNCNNGWMSQLENRVKPIVEGIFKLQTTNLDSNSQKILAAWSVKNAMVLEALRPTQSWFFLDSERETLMKTLQMPSWTHVWVAKCVNYQGVFSSGLDLGGATKISSSSVQGFVTTLGFGPLAIQVLNLRFAEEADPNASLTVERQSSPIDITTLPIWPLQHQAIRWPPLNCLSGESDLESLSKRWIYHQI